jgi:hypothetical protein
MKYRLSAKEDIGKHEPCPTLRWTPHEANLRRAQAFAGMPLYLELSLNSSMYSAHGFERLVSNDSMMVFESHEIAMAVETQRLRVLQVMPLAT